MNCSSIVMFAMVLSSVEVIHLVALIISGMAGTVIIILVLDVLVAAELTISNIVVLTE